MLLSEATRHIMWAAAAIALSALSVQSFSGCSSDVTAGSKGSLIGSLDVEHKPDFESVEPKTNAFNFVGYELPNVIVPLGSQEFGMLRKLDDAEFTLGRVNDSLDLIWSLPIHTGDQGYEAGLFRSGSNICAIMTEFTESDSVKAVAYMVDATTGKLIKSQTLDAHPGNIRWLRKGPKGFGPYRVNFSPDSSKILLSNNDYSDQNDDTLKIACNTILLDRDLNVLSRSKAVVTSVFHKDHPDHYYGTLPANDGSIVQVVRRGLDTVTVIRTLPGEGGRQISARYILPRSASGDLPFEIASSMAFRVTPNSDVVVAIGCQMPDRARLLGLRLLKFPASGAMPTLMADYSFSDEVARRMVDEKYFEDYQIRDLDLTVGNRALVFAERSHEGTRTYTSGSGLRGGFTTTREIPYLEVGPLLVFAFDSTATNKWRVALMKKQETNMLDGALEVGHSRRIDRNGDLQVTYMDRENDGLIWGKLGVDDGGVKQFETPLVFGKASSYFRNYTTWMDDSTMIIAGRKALSTDRMQLYKIRYLTYPAVAK